MMHLYIGPDIALDAWTILFLVACAVNLLATTYLILTHCYKTGFLGSLGFGLMGIGLYFHLSLWWKDWQLEIPGRVTFIVVGFMLFILQTVWRTWFPPIRDKKGRHLEPNGPWRSSLDS